MDPIQSKIESILLVSGEAIAVKKLADLLAITPKEAEQKLASLRERYQEQASGLDVVVRDGKAQMRTAAANQEIVASFKTDEVREITPAALQTLAVIAYLGPITKLELDDIRGINSVYSLRNLLVRGVIEKIKDGAAVKYRVSMDFMHHFGLNDLAELPRYHELRTSILEELLQGQGSHT